MTLFQTTTIQTTASSPFPLNTAETQVGLELTRLSCNVRCALESVAKSAAGVATRAHSLEDAAQAVRHLVDYLASFPAERLGPAKEAEATHVLDKFLPVPEPGAATRRSEERLGAVLADFSALWTRSRCGGNRYYEAWATRYRGTSFELERVQAVCETLLGPNAVFAADAQLPLKAALLGALAKLLGEFELSLERHLRGCDTAARLTPLQVLALLAFANEHADETVETQLVALARIVAPCKQPLSDALRLYAANEPLLRRLFADWRWLEPVDLLRPASRDELRRNRDRSPFAAATEPLPLARSWSSRRCSRCPWRSSATSTAGRSV